MERIRIQKQICEMVMIQGIAVSDVIKKTGLSQTSVYRYIRNFEAENPILSEQMKKKGKDLTPDDYRKLQEENARLRSELKREKVLKDFYEEMVRFGEETYGINLKKAGTK